MNETTKYALDLLKFRLETNVKERVASLDRIELQKRKGINRSESDIAKHYARADRLLLQIESLEAAIEILENY